MRYNTGTSIRGSENVTKMEKVTMKVCAIHNEYRTFVIKPVEGKSLLEIVNEGLEDPRREGIPFLCRRGACRSCTVKVVESPDLLSEPSRLEQRALAVGPTSIERGHRLACMCTFRAD